MSSESTTNPKKLPKQYFINQWAQTIHPSFAENDFLPIKKFSSYANGCDLRLVGLKRGLQWCRHKGNQELCPIARDEVERTIAAVVMGPSSDFGSKDIAEIRKMAELLAEKQDKNSSEKMIIPEDDVAPVRSLTNTGWCYKRLPFDPDINADPTIWQEEVFTRIKTNLDPFLAWIGSLFDPRSNREKYVWMWGAGETGKSTITEVILEMFGDAGATRRHKKIDSNWFTSTLVGVRLCHLPEARADLVGNGDWKTLTGERYHEIERKGEQPRNATLHTKFLITSNDQPTLPHGNEHLRRIVLVETAKPDGWVATRTTDETMSLLRDGLPWFLARCADEYELNPKIICDTSDAESIQEECPHQVMFDRLFKIDAHSTCTISEIRNATELYKKGDLSRFLKWCEDHKGAKRKQLDAQNKGVCGIRRKNGW